jgi:ATP-dependent DNA helicase RecQ
VYGDTPTQQAIQSLIEELFSGPQELVLNLYQLSRDHDLRPLVLRTLLTYLELDGYLESLTPVYASYRFKPSASSREILNHYEGEEKRFLADILKHSVKKRIWFEIDIDATALALGRDRIDVVRCLDRCGQDGWLEIKASNLRFRYLVKQKPANLDLLAQELYQKAQEREEQEVGRLGQALRLAVDPGCVARRLALHFGEELEADCGTCSHCLGEFEAQPQVAPAEEFRIGRLPEGLSEPRNGARFLCGLTSPALQKAKLTKHPDFGRLGHISFGSVLAKLREA